MQQHISPEWLGELTAEEQDVLREMWEPGEGDWFRLLRYKEHMEYFKNDKYESRPAFLYYESHDPFIVETPDKKEGDLPLLSIGKMIELLIEHGESDEYDLYPTIGFSGDYRYPKVGFYWQDREEGKELARALWEAVKEVIKAKAREVCDG